ncbi:hypothetical protein DFQ30_002206 [Apophysomyces sp. BC1015]|nr:hypothetical protein DFQ30_002206 [Apophysomyces sp. BC1015]
MSGHGSGSASTTPKKSMMMSMMGTYHWTTFNSDAILLEAWYPESESGYIGACFGLMFFAILSRGLMAVETYFASWRSMRAAAAEAQKAQPTDSALKDSEKHAAYPASLSKFPTVPPFDWVMDPARSFLTLVASFISYLLMMIVMTGNGGFFISILGGIFIGELLFGRFRSLGGFHDDHQH